MPGRPIVVIHGWSDSSESFENLVKHLGDRLDRPVEQLYLGDWVSMNDDVSYRDLRVALKREWRRVKLPTQPFSADVMVHSTAALIVRDWMSSEYEPDQVPVGT